MPWVSGSDPGAGPAIGLVRWLRGRSFLVVSPAHRVVPVRVHSIDTGDRAIGIVVTEILPPQAFLIERVLVTVRVVNEDEPELGVSEQLLIWAFPRGIRRCTSGAADGRPPSRSTPVRDALPRKGPPDGFRPAWNPHPRSALRRGSPGPGAFRRSHRVSRSGLSAAISYISSRIPPSSSNERHTLKPPAACSLARCNCVRPWLSRTSPTRTPFLRSLPASALESTRNTSVRLPSCRREATS